MSNKVLTVSQLNVFYKNSNRLFHKTSSQIDKRHVIKDVSFQLLSGEILGLVGESGSGKSTLAKAILGMVKDCSGEIVHMSSMPQMIFQDPYSSLNPVKNIGWILEEPLRLMGGSSAAERKRLVAEMLCQVGLDEQYSKHYPAELSGGQRQRVCIAQALMRKPQLIIADEPVSALDVTVQNQILDLLLRLQKEYGMAILFISHDLRIVYQMCQKVMVLKEGSIVEMGDTQRVYTQPVHGYTRLLLQAAGAGRVFR